MKDATPLDIEAAFTAVEWDATQLSCLTRLQKPYQACLQLIDNITTTVVNGYTAGTLSALRADVDETCRTYAHAVNLMGPNRPEKAAAVKHVRMARKAFWDALDRLGLPASQRGLTNNYLVALGVAEQQLLLSRYAAEIGIEEGRF